MWPEPLPKEPKTPQVATVQTEEPQGHRYSKWLLWEPYPKQRLFLDATEREVGFGGAAGGAKTVAQIMAALQYVDVPHYNALIIRKVSKDLHKPDSVIPIAHEFLQNTGAKWNEQKLKWTFPSGAILQFDHLEDTNAHYRYQSAAYQYIGFDELTHWPNDVQYRYLFSRLRKRSDGLDDVPLRMRATFNPGGAGHEWVKARFIGPDDDPTWEMPESRRFIPSFLEDNLGLDKDSYIESLGELDPVTLAQLLHGDWKASATGKYFRKDWFKFVNEAPPLTRWVRGWDTGASENGDPSAGVKLGVFGRDVFIADVRRGRWDTPTVTRKVLETAQEDGPEVAVAIEQAHFALAVIQDLSRNPEFARFPLIKIPIAGRDKETRSRGWRARLGNGEVYLVRGAWNEQYIDECLRFTNEKTNTDDQIDGTSVAFEAVFKTTGGITESRTVTPLGTFKEYEHKFKETKPFGS